MLPRCTHCRAEIEAADQFCNLIKSQHTAGPGRLRSDLTSPGAWQGIVTTRTLSHWHARPGRPGNPQHSVMLNSDNACGFGLCKSALPTIRSTMTTIGREAACVKQTIESHLMPATNYNVIIFASLPRFRPVCQGRQ